jgi:hypothetical protein
MPNGFIIKQCTRVGIADSRFANKLGLLVLTDKP